MSELQPRDQRYQLVVMVSLSKHRFSELPKNRLSDQQQPGFRLSHVDPTEFQSPKDDIEI